MNHKLGLEAAVAYGRLFKFVINVEQDKFTQAFEEFLDAYDADNTEKIHVNVKVSEGEDITEKVFQAIQDALEHANFNGDVEKIAKANDLKFDKQRENSRLSELCKRFIDNENVNFFSASKQNDGSIRIRFEEIREV